MILYICRIHGGKTLGPALLREHRSCSDPVSIAIQEIGFTVKYKSIPNKETRRLLKVHWCWNKHTFSSGNSELLQMYVLNTNQNLLAPVPVLPAILKTTAPAGNNYEMNCNSPENQQTGCHLSCFSTLKIPTSGKIISKTSQTAAVTTPLTRPSPGRNQCRFTPWLRWTPLGNSTEDILSNRNAARQAHTFKATHNLFMAHE